MATELPKWDVVEDDSDKGMTLNGEPIPFAEPEEEQSPEGDIRDWLIFMGLDDRANQCPLCGHPLVRAHESEYQDGGEGHLDRVLQVLVCHHCAYWFYCNCVNIGASAYGCPFATLTTSRLPCLKRFTKQLPDGCASELAQLLRRDPSKWHTMEPRTFERFVADVFRANHADAEVVHVGKPADGGVDVYFVDSGQEWLIQVKRRESPTASEGVSTLRSLLGTLVLEGSMSGMIVSSADHFTYQAARAKDRATDLGFQLKLIDRGILDRMLDLVLPDRPWLQFVRDDQPDWYDRFADAIPNRRQEKLF